MKKILGAVVLVVCLPLVSLFAETQPLIHTYERWEGYSLERIALPAEDGDAIPFILLRPHTRKKVPVVLAFHGITGSKENMLEQGNFASGGDLTLKLLKQGYAVASLDFRMHGERGETYPDFESYFNAVLANWISVYTLSYADALVCVDYLNSRRDLKQQISLVGYSMGGMFTFSMAAEHPDMFVTAVACVTPTLTGTNYPGSPELYAPTIDTIPFLMMAALHDENYVMSDVLAVFGAIAESDKKLSIYDSGHGLPLSYTDEVVMWIKKYMPTGIKRP